MHTQGVSSKINFLFLSFEKCNILNNTSLFQEVLTDNSKTTKNGSYIAFKYRFSGFCKTRCGSLVVKRKYFQVRKLMLHMINGNDITKN